MKELCHLYADKMRAESKATTQIPKDKTAFLHYFSKSFSVCTVPGIAQNALRALLSKGNYEDKGKEAADAIWKLNLDFPKSIGEWKKAVFVRHPLERLVSVYRLVHYLSNLVYYKVLNSNNFVYQSPNQYQHSILHTILFHDRSHFAPKSEGGEAKSSFREFVDMVADGYFELSTYLDEHDLRGKSVGINTGMVDGITGESKNWDPIWRHCGVCQLHLQPKYILHMEHAHDDLKVYHLNRAYVFNHLIILPTIIMYILHYSLF